MSHCVNIITEKQLEPNEIFEVFMAKGESIVVTSDEFPCVKFGRKDESLRGIEINKEEFGYEIRICSCCSRADYELFFKAIEIVSQLSGGKAYEEFDEETPLKDPKDAIKDIDSDIMSSWSMIRILVRTSGTPVIMDGLFLPYCVGASILEDKISLYAEHEDDKEAFEWFMKYFTLMQWAHAYAENTLTQLVVKAPNNEQLGISAIVIENNQVKPFDYIAYAPLVGFFDLDKGDTIIVRFENLRRIAKLTEVDLDLASFDDYQMRICSGDSCDAEMTVEQVRAMMDTARRFEHEALHIAPTYPGSGYDKEQNTFVFMWNTETSDFSVEEHVDSMKGFYTGIFKQRIHEWKEAKMGDRFYLMRVGDGKLGIVMAGVIASQPYVSPEWSGKGRKKYEVNIEPTLMINPETAPMLTVEDIEKEIPDFMWRGGYSGRKLTPQQAERLEKIYANYLEKPNMKVDGENICLKRHL